MQTSPLAQYDEITSFIVRFEVFASKLNYSLQIGNLKNLKRAFRSFWEFDFLRARQPAAWTELGGEVPVPNDEEGKVFHKVLFSEFQFDELSSALRTSFPNVDFAQMAKLHKLRSAQFLRFNVGAILGFVFGLGTLVMKSAPKSVVEHVMNYEDFETLIFGITVAIVVYLAVILAPIWFKHQRAKFQSDRIGDILEYIAAFGHPSSKQPGAAESAESESTASLRSTLG